MMYHMGMYFDNRYSRRNYFEDHQMIIMLNQNNGVYLIEYYLGNTPLNESLVYINTLLPMFKKNTILKK